MMVRWLERSGCRVIGGAFLREGTETLPYKCAIGGAVLRDDVGIVPYDRKCSCLRGGKPAPYGRKCWCVGVGEAFRLPPYLPPLSQKSEIFARADCQLKMRRSGEQRIFDITFR